MNQKRMAVMGAGSLGMILGAFLTRAGYQCDLIDTNQEHVDALNTFGARVIGTSEFITPVHALTPDQMKGKYDIFFYLAKQTANADAIPKMKQHLAPDGVVVVMQNGIPEVKVAEYIGKEHILGAPIGWAATWIGPGVSSVNSKKEAYSIDLGEYEGPITPRVLEIKTILEAMATIHPTDNLMGNRWLKLLVNCCVSGLSAVTGGTFGDVMDHPGSFDIMMQIAKEVIEVGRALGVKFEKWLGVYDLGNDLHWTNEDEKAKAKTITLEAFESGRKGIASMLQDIQKGKKTEIFAINGHVVQEGKKCGIPTPANQFIVDVVRRHEMYLSKPDFKWIDYYFEKYVKK